MWGDRRERLRCHQILKIWHDLCVLGFKRGRWLAWLFLEHHKREGMNQEEEGGKQQTKQHKNKAKNQMQFIKAKGGDMHECNMMR